MKRPTNPTSRRTLLTAGLAVPIAAGLTGAVASSAAATPANARRFVPERWDHHLKSTPGNLHWGGFPIDAKPGVTMRSGETVRVDALSQQGLTGSVSPVDYMAQFGIKPSEVLADATAFWESLPARRAANQNYGGGHVMTGPVYVKGAMPGDTLAIEYLALDTRVDYGFNGTSPTSGVMATSYPGWRQGDVPLNIPSDLLSRTHMYRSGIWHGKEVIHFSDSIKIPTHKFMGTIAVAPPTGEFVGSTPDASPPATGVQSSTEPGKYGGNMDNRDLTVGTTLYLPVWQPGGQLFMGDSHSVQGDGEVSQTAVEHSLSGTFRITVLKNTPSELPWAETDTDWLIMGIDWDLDRAIKIAVQKTIDFLGRTQGMTIAEAYSFASLAVNYHVSEVVDKTQVVTGYIPKSVFLRKPSHSPHSW
ncbi:acetamidase/formamidase family protein [Actinacidiphila sp. ITFR-21]|uniref:acetamidase/formamidase family protein n=1 Tax=Actinacidiphila sp. ITFR-21 TaxID=3075199 RepID=UPI002889A720|nr:acetamidase/formamidase family protein [Streptomyces sp. ITFR-21]WNI18769.1 acetamidase/formamidase family protein [Streptomyces sp. ITFR-21]